jgi:predicted transcriptional regulator
MATKASTHRLDPSVQAALDHLSDLLQRPKNRLINEAVKLYVQQKSREVEQELEGTLKALRADRRQDPDFEGAIEEFVNAEAKMAGSDPAEGGSHAAKGAPRTAKSHVQAQIRRKLHAA